MPPLSFEPSGCPCLSFSRRMPLPLPAPAPESRSQNYYLNQTIPNMANPEASLHVHSKNASYEQVLAMRKAWSKKKSKKENFETALKTLIQELAKAEAGARQNLAPPAHQFWRLGQCVPTRRVEPSMILSFRGPFTTLDPAMTLPCPSTGTWTRRASYPRRSSRSSLTSSRRTTASSCSRSRASPTCRRAAWTRQCTAACRSLPT